MKIKNRLEYFWDFYKWPFLAALVLLILGASFLAAALSQKECVLSVMLLDCYAEVSQEEMKADILQGLQLDEKKHAVEMQNNLMLDNTEAGGYAMTSISRFLADIGSEKLDVCGMLEQTFLKYDNAATFLDLRTCFSEQELESFANALLITADGRVIGLYADQLPRMQTDGCYDSRDARGVIGIVYNTKHPEMAKQYLLYLARITE